MDIKSEIGGLRKKLSECLNKLYRIIRRERLQSELKQELSNIKRNIGNTISKLEEIEDSLE